MSRYRDRLPQSYEEAVKALRGRHVRTVLNNTRVSRKDDDTVEVQYHGNTIATFHADGRRVFTTCGWGTSSTRERLNGMLWGTSIGFVQQGGVNYVQIIYVGGKRDLTNADTLYLGPDGSIHRIEKEH